MNPNPYLLSLQHRPNESIFFESIDITQINGCPLMEPFESHLKLHLSPRISFRIESEHLPIELANSGQECFRITTAGGFETNVYLRYNLNNLMQSKDYFKGYLIPAELPCTVMDSETEIKRISFGILNFLEFYGRDDQWTNVDGISRRIGSMKTCLNDFQLEITECLGFSENKRFLSQHDGYSLTHVGFVKRIDEAKFSVGKIGDILRATRAFLSFARGSACGLTLVKATMLNGEDKLLQWGTTQTEPWICGSETWLLTTEGGDILSQLFPRFYELCRDSTWSDTIFSIIDWYLNSNESPFHIGTILTQAALEAISYKILQREVKPMQAQIRNALSSMDIGTEIPTSCLELSRWVRAVQRSSAKSHGDGPEAITRIRNDLVHADKKYGQIPAKAQIDALNLSQWYIEMILFKKLGYVGRYRNRVSNSGRCSVEYVPWNV